MKKIIISFLVLALMSGCKSSLSNSDKANKYVLLFSNDKAETFDTSSFVYYNAAGEPVKMILMEHYLHSLQNIKIN